MEPDETHSNRRAYPYWNGWHITGCAVIFFGLIGLIAVSLIPLGYEKLRADNLPLGIALIVIGIFGIPTLAMALFTFAGGVRDTFRPPLLVVEPTALVLPNNLRENSTEHDPELPKQPPAHPEALPLSAIRTIRRMGPRNPGSDKLVIVHDLSKQELTIEQHMMSTPDFNELEEVLRALVPFAFTPEA